MPIAFELDTEHIEEGILKMADWPDLAIKPIREVLAQTAREIREDAARTISRQGPPRSAIGQPPARETGDLLSMLKTKVARSNTRKGERAYVRSKVQVKQAYYGFMLESGTKGMKPRPYLVDARARHAATFLERVRAAIDIAIRESTS